VGLQFRTFRVLAIELFFTSDPNFSALPTYPVVLSLKGADTDVNLFSQRIKGRPIPGMPPMNPNRIVRFLSFSLSTL
jgi:hypothetical protein